MRWQMIDEQMARGAEMIMRFSCALDYSEYCAKVGIVLEKAAAAAAVTSGPTPLRLKDAEGPH